MNIKHLLSIVLVFVLSLGICSVALADENAEIPEGYTPIYTAEELNNIRSNLSGKYILMNDIDLSIYENWEPIGSEKEPFTGEFDGNGFRIMNLTSENGFFANVNGATISNLGVYNCNISGYIGPINRYKGGIANNAVNTIFENCYVTGEIFGTTGNGQIAIAYRFYPGGVVGFSEASCFKSCYSNVDFSLEYTVMEPYAAGGLVGQAKDSEFVCCYSTPEFSEKFIGYGNTEGMDIYTGGLIGESISGNIFENCYYSDNSDYAIGKSEENPKNTKPLTEEELKNQSSYEGFDFENIWSTEEKGYAVLDFTKIKNNKPDVKPEEPAVYLSEAEIIKIPFEKRIVFGQLPKSPEGIEIKLTYCDGKIVTDKITANENGYYVNGECVITAEYETAEKYGIKNAGYYLNESKLYLSYKYLALPSLSDLFEEILSVFS
ncbi:MAG: hypothetical protein IJE72_01535 [Clostridia bacterium]|nr:hypothetical protein [Clostridia bacterium]